jgi:hypothetical protein
VRRLRIGPITVERQYRIVCGAILTGLLLWILAGVMVILWAGAGIVKALS